MFVVPGEGNECHKETLWAADLGSDLFCLDNSPFFAYGVSWQDVVHAPWDNGEDFHVFKEVKKRSGNRTIRIHSPAGISRDKKLANVVRALEKIGCTWEGANSKYISLNIPPTTEFDFIVTALTEHKIEWEHADPTYEEYVNRQDQGFLPHAFADVVFYETEKGGRKGPTPASFWGGPVRLGRRDYLDVRLIMEKEGPLSPGDTRSRVPIGFLSPDLFSKKAKLGEWYPLCEGSHPIGEIRVMEYRIPVVNQTWDLRSIWDWFRGIAQAKL